MARALRLDPFNSVRSSSLLSHGEKHDEIRSIETRPLTPERLAEYQPTVKKYARDLVDGLTSMGRWMMFSTSPYGYRRMWPPTWSGWTTRAEGTS